MFCKQSNKSGSSIAIKMECQDSDTYLFVVTKNPHPKIAQQEEG